jgi:hypothetical protein
MGSPSCTLDVVQRISVVRNDVSTKELPCGGGIGSGVRGLRQSCASGSSYLAKLLWRLRLRGDANRIGVELAGLGQQKRQEIVEWLRERRDAAALHEDRVETVEWAILVFVVLGVVV